MNKKELLQKELYEFIKNVYYDELPVTDLDITESLSYPENVLKYASIIISYEGLECILESNNSMNVQDFLVAHLKSQDGDTLEDLALSIYDLVFDYYKDLYLEDMLCFMSKADYINKINDGYTSYKDVDNGETRWVTKFGVFANVK